MRTPTALAGSSLVASRLRPGVDYGFSVGPRRPTLDCFKIMGSSAADDVSEPAGVDLGSGEVQRSEANVSEAGGAQMAVLADRAVDTVGPSRLSTFGPCFMHAALAAVKSRGGTSEPSHGVKSRHGNGAECAYPCSRQIFGRFFRPRSVVRRRSNPHNSRHARW